MGSIKITNKVSDESITKSDLINSNATKNLSNKQKQKIGLIFDAFNTKKAAAGEEEVLDRNEQVAMMDWFQKVAGKNNKLGWGELDEAKTRKSTKHEYAKGARFSDYKNFMNAFKEVVFKSKVKEADSEPEVKADPVNEGDPGELADVLEPVENKGEKIVEQDTEGAPEGLAVKPKTLRKVSQPKAWQNANPTEAIEKLTTDDNTADKVLAKLMETYGIEVDKVQADKLKADLIKYNPSIFDSNGKLYNGVIWGKLDFPKNAGELYKIGAETPKVVKKSIAKKSGSKHVATKRNQDAAKEANSVKVTLHKQGASDAVNGILAAQKHGVKLHDSLKKGDLKGLTPANIAHAFTSDVNFGPNSKQIAAKVYSLMLKRMEQLGIKQDSDRKIKFDNYKELNTKLHEMRNRIIDEENKIVKTDRVEKESYNKDLPKVQAQIDKANQLLVKVANNTKGLKIQRETDSDGVRYASTTLKNGQWLEVTYNQQGKIANIKISHDKTPDKGSNEEFDGAEVFYSENLVQVSTIHDGKWNYRINSKLSNYDQLLKLAEAIFGTDEPEAKPEK